MSHALVPVPLSCDPLQVATEGYHIFEKPGMDVRLVRFIHFCIIENANFLDLDFLGSSLLWHLPELRWSRVHLEG